MQIVNRLYCCMWLPSSSSFLKGYVLQGIKQSNAEFSIYTKAYTHTKSSIIAFPFISREEAALHAFSFAELNVEALQAGVALCVFWTWILPPPRM